jgi:hypothetical protein
MSCNKSPINKSDTTLNMNMLRCTKRKGHTGMCEMVYKIQWWGK